MKKFRFSLARVKDWRNQQLEMEELKLPPLLAERRALATEAARLDREETEAGRTIATLTAAEAEELAAFDSWIHHLRREKERLAARQADCEQRIRTQQKAILEARRRLRLLERLEHRRFSDWLAQADHEQEALSQELYLARWRPREKT